MKAKNLFGNLLPLAVAATLAAPWALASNANQQGVPAQGPHQEDEVPDTLIVKVKLDDKDNEILSGAKLIPLKVKIKLGEAGVDLDSLVRECDDAMADAEQIDIEHQGMTDGPAPTTIQEEFDYADSLMDTESVRWRVWTPVGSVGSGYRGYYGYGHYPSYGYRSGYRSYYPRWGYYRSGRHYPYHYGHSRRYGGYSYHYYRR